MIRSVCPALLLVLLVIPGTAHAGKYNRKLSIGDAAPAWTDLEGVDGKKRSLSDLKGTELVVVVFTSNECPVAQEYQERITAFAKKYSAPGKLAVVAINVSKGEKEELPAMKKVAEKQGYTFPYVTDPSQDIGRKYGATATPQFFVINKDRKIVYMGSMDDNLLEEKVKKRYLEPAIEALRAGKEPPVAETRSFGCAIEYERKP